MVISDVTPDGPAASAGLQVQDIVLTADDRRMETLPAFSAALYLHPLDSPLKVEVLRGSEKKTLQIPAIEKRDPMDQFMDAAEKSLVPGLGIFAMDLSDQLRSKLGNLRIPSGVVVVGRAVDLIGPDSGLQTADIIHSLNTMPLDSVDSLRKTVKELKPGAPVVLQVERDGKLLYQAFEME